MQIRRVHPIRWPGVLPALLALLAAAGCSEPESPPPPDGKTQQAGNGTNASKPTLSTGDWQEAQSGSQTDDALPDWLTESSAWNQALIQSGDANAADINIEGETSPEVLLAVGEDALSRGKVTLAARAFSRALTLKPGSLDARRGLAVTCTAMNLHEEAVELYRQILRHDSTDVDTRFNLAVARYRMGRTLLAEETYRQVLQEKPDHIRARFNLAALLSEHDRQDEAVEQWEILVNRYQPEFAAGWAGLGESLLSQGKPRKAGEAFTKAAHLRGEAGDWLNASEAARTSGRMGTAMALARRAIQADPNSPDGYRRLGRLLLETSEAFGGSIGADKKRSMQLEAMEAWRKSLQIDPSQDVVRKWIDSLRAELN